MSLPDDRCETTVYKLRQLCPNDFKTASETGLLGWGGHWTKSWGWGDGPLHERREEETGRVKGWGHVEGVMMMTMMMTMMMMLMMMMLMMTVGKDDEQRRLDPIPLVGPSCAFC
jgi:hypothetical protein